MSAVIPIVPDLAVSFYENKVRFQETKHDPYCLPLLRKIGWVVRDVLAVLAYQISRPFAHCCGAQPVDLFSLHDYRKGLITEHLGKQNPATLAEVGNYGFSYFGLWVLYKRMSIENQTHQAHQAPPANPEVRRTSLSHSSDPGIRVPLTPPAQPLVDTTGVRPSISLPQSPSAAVNPPSPSRQTLAEQEDKEKTNTQLSTQPPQSPPAIVNPPSSSRPSIPTEQEDKRKASTLAPQTLVLQKHISEQLEVLQTFDDHDTLKISYNTLIAGLHEGYRKAGTEPDKRAIEELRDRVQAHAVSKGLELLSPDAPPTHNTQLPAAGREQEEKHAREGFSKQLEGLRSEIAAILPAFEEETSPQNLNPIYSGFMKRLDEIESIAGDEQGRMAIADLRREVTAFAENKGLIERRTQHSSRPKEAEAKHLLNGSTNRPGNKQTDPTKISEQISASIEGLAKLTPQHVLTAQCQLIRKRIDQFESIYGKMDAYNGISDVLRTQLEQAEERQIKAIKDRLSQDVSPEETEVVQEQEIKSLRESEGRVEDVEEEEDVEDVEEEEDAEDVEEEDKAKDESASFDFDVGIDPSLIIKAGKKNPQAAGAEFSRQLMEAVNAAKNTTQVDTILKCLNKESLERYGQKTGISPKILGNSVTAIKALGLKRKMEIFEEKLEKQGSKMKIGTFLSIKEALEQLPEYLTNRQEKLEELWTKWLSKQRDPIKDKDYAGILKTLKDLGMPVDKVRDRISEIEIHNKMIAQKKACETLQGAVGRVVTEVQGFCEKQEIAFAEIQPWIQNIFKIIQESFADFKPAWDSNKEGPASEATQAACLYLHKKLEIFMKIFAANPKSVESLKESQELLKSIQDQLSKLSANSSKIKVVYGTAGFGQLKITTEDHWRALCWTICASGELQIDSNTDNDENLALQAHIAQVHPSLMQF